MLEPGTTTEFLCGNEWFRKHQHDYTEEYIASLSIIVTCEGREMPAIRQNGKRGIVRDLVKMHRKEGK